MMVFFHVDTEFCLLVFWVQTCVWVCVCVVRCGVLRCSVCWGWEEAVPRRPWPLGSGDLPACRGGVAGSPSPWAGRCAPPTGPGREESPRPHCGWVARPGQLGDKHWPSLFPQTLPCVRHGDQVPVRTWQDLPHANPGLAGLILIAFCHSWWISLQLTNARPAVC